MDAAILLSALSSLDPVAIEAALANLHAGARDNLLAAFGSIRAIAPPAEAASSSRTLTTAHQQIAAPEVPQTSAARRFHFEPNIEEGEVPQEDPLVITNGARVAHVVTDVLRTAVSRFGLEPCRLDEYVNFLHADVEKVASNKGVFIVTSPPQSDKVRTCSDVCMKTMSRSCLNAS